MSTNLRRGRWTAHPSDQMKRLLVGVLLISSVVALPLTQPDDYLYDEVTTEEIKTESIKADEVRTKVESTTVSTTVPPSTTTTLKTTTIDLKDSRIFYDDPARPRDSIHDLPSSCEGAYPIMNVQPTDLDLVVVPKCCPLGENFQYDAQGQRHCAPETLEFNVSVIRAKFYRDCIEDLEVEVKYELVHHPTQRGFYYNLNYGDILFVIQNGSLLRIDEGFMTFDLFDEYCLDMDDKEGVLTAIAYRTGDDGIVHVSKLQGYICATFMLFSVPCLIFTAILYWIVPELNDLHGKSLALHCSCLAIGYFLLAIVQFRGSYGFVVGYAIQYFILQCFFWLLIMVIDIAAHAWHYLPKGIRNTPEREKRRFLIYGSMAVLVPFVFVIAAIIEGIPGVPSYYLRADSLNSFASQKYFIPPVSIILLVSLVLYVFIRVGMKKVEEINVFAFLYNKALQKKKAIAKKSRQPITEAEQMVPLLNNDHIEKVEVMATSTAFLLGIMIVNWLCEILSFFFTHSQISPILFFDIVNALQGVFIFMIFVCLPRPYKFIHNFVRRNYSDRGSLDLRQTELELICPNQ